MNKLTKLDLSNYLDQGVLLLDIDRNVRFWNKWLERYSQIKKIDAMGKSLENLFPEIVEKSGYQRVLSALKNNETVVLSPTVHHYLIPLQPSNVKRKSGIEYMHQMVRGLYITKSEYGDGLLLFITDVSDKYLSDQIIKNNFKEIHEKNKKLIRAKENLHSLNNNLKIAQEIAQLGSWERNIADNSEIWSDEQYRIFGYEPNEIEPTYEHFVSAIHPKDRERVITAVKAALEKNVPYNLS